MDLAWLLVGAGAALAVFSWVVFGIWGSVVGLVIGVIVLDLGIQAAMVSNQHIVFALHPESRGRLDTIYMSGLFIGGAIGSAGATYAWNEGGWLMVSLFGGLLSVVAFALHAAKSWAGREAKRRYPS